MKKKFWDEMGKAYDKLMAKQKSPPPKYTHHFDPVWLRIKNLPAPLMPTPKKNKLNPLPLRFEYWRSISPSPLWFWHLKSHNGEIIAQGEGYRRESSCLRIYALLTTVSLQAPKKLPIAPPTPSA